MEQGEELVGLVLTTGQHVFTHGPEPVSAPIWWVVTQHRCWFIATIDDQHWFIGDGDAKNVRIESNWTETRVWIGPWNMPLRAGTRRPAKQLLKRWQALATDFSSLPAPLPEALRLVGSAADGAEGLPSWWANQIAGQPDEKWLLAIHPGVTFPFNAYSGDIVESPVYVGISDNRTVVASRSPWGELWSEELTQPITWKKPLVGKIKVAINERVFYAPRTSEKQLSNIRKFKGASGDQRWAIAASRALAKGAPMQATQLWAQAIRRDQAASLWLDLAATAVVYEETATAAAILLHTVRPSSTTRFGAWSKRIKPIQTALKGTDIEWGQIQRALHPAMARFLPPKPPEGLPYPPENPSEVWAYALGCAHHWREAQAIWTSLPDNARNRQGVAACLTADPATDGTEAWLHAAAACRAEGLQQQSL